MSGYSHKVGPELVYHGTEGHAVPPGCGEVVDAHVIVAVSDAATPLLQAFDLGRHGDGSRGVTRGKSLCWG